MVLMLSGDMMTDPLRKAVYDFMSRDHEDDVDSLNRALSKKGDAGLVRHMPPIPFTGDVYSMKPNDCILLLGINPLWPAPNKIAHKSELEPAMKMIRRFQSGDKQSFDKYFNSRINYFQTDYANWGHFNKTGFGYSEFFYPKESLSSVWNKHAIAVDVIPYFSKDTSSIESNRIEEAVRTNPALLAHQKILEQIIQLIRPSMIHLNGAPAIQVVEDLYCKKKMDRIGPLGKQFNLRFGEATVGNQTIEVFAHNQFASWAANPSKKHWPRMYDEWNQWKRA